ncbi:MAG: TIGR02281 family clan AA aspartic protease [Gammaproteobacteria bacterium]|nr:TIGR02281 family clan AA aspartic protease [Gammaproteobacteria bacterium]
MLALLSALICGSAAAVERIKVVALFTDKAMVEIDGVRRLLKAGASSPEGVKLISANARGALIEVDGRREQYRLGASYGGNFARAKAFEVRIARNPQGAFVTVGTINGRQVQMLVDTGATAVAMSEPEARRLGIRYRLNGKRSGVRTASGYARAYQVTLDQVQVGEIALRNIEAVVIEGDSPTQVLLGMSFLRQVEMDVGDAVLVLRDEP